MSNLTILNVGQHNFSCEFQSTRFFFQFYYKTIILFKLANLQVRLFKKNFYHQNVHKKPHTRHFTVTLVFQAVFELLLLQSGKNYWRKFPEH